MQITDVLTPTQQSSPPKEQRGLVPCMEFAFLCIGTALSRAELPLGTEVYYTAKITPPLPLHLPRPPKSILPAVVNVQCPHLKEVTGEILTRLLVAEWTDEPHALEHSPMVHSLFPHICARSYQL